VKERSIASGYTSQTRTLDAKLSVNRTSQWVWRGSLETPDAHLKGIAQAIRKFVLNHFARISLCMRSAVRFASLSTIASSAPVSNGSLELNSSKMLREANKSSIASISAFNLDCRVCRIALNHTLCCARHRFGFYRTQRVAVAAPLSPNTLAAFNPTEA
jgi:hypothetical protein